MMSEMAEEHELIGNSQAFDRVIIILENAICYMQEQGMSKEDIKGYLGINEGEYYGIDNKDYEAFIKRRINYGS